jgi:hypothetical protein
MSNHGRNTYAEDQLLVVSVGLVSVSLIAFFFLVVSWVIGGDAYMTTIYGKESMVLSLLGTGVGVALAANFREKPASSSAALAAMPKRGAVSA